MAQIKNDLGFQKIKQIELDLDNLKSTFITKLKALNMETELYSTLFH